MNGIVRVFVAFALIVPLCAKAVAEGTVFSPTSRPNAAPGTGKSGAGPVFRPTGKQDAPAAPQTAPSSLPAPPAIPMGADDWGNPQVEIAYKEPQDQKFQPIRERLMSRRALEQLRLFLAPLKLPRKLLVQIDQCNAPSRPYEPGGPVTICYEQVARIESTVPLNPPAGAMPRDVTLVGAFIQTVLHEVSLAIFDVFDVPVWGRESDAADRLSAFIMVQFGRQVSLRVLIGAALYFDIGSERPWARDDFASTEAPEAQRLFNYLCIGFGSDPTTFRFLLERNLLPPRRAQRCTLEFYGLKFAFDNTILPHVDAGLLKKVQGGEWMRLDQPR